MANAEVPPLIRVVDRGEICHLFVDTPHMITPLRDHIDKQRGDGGVNFHVPRVGDVSVRLGYDRHIMDVIGSFAAVQIVPVIE